MKIKKIISLLLFFVLGFGMLNPLYADDSSLIGAGATFPYPFYSKLFEVYHAQHGITVNYQAIGSGGGQRQLLNKTVDFGASDAFMSNGQLAKAPAKILHIPTCMGAVVLTYNLPGNPTLRLTPDVIADVFLGKITAWTDPRIEKLNPNVHFPNQMIVTVHRSDGSGTNFIFTDYLSKVSRAWMKVGEGLSVNWPNGLGAKGNPGVAGLIKQTPGSMGYVELIYAVQNNMPYAILKNKSKKWIKPSLASVTAAANIPQIPEDTRTFITDSAAAGGYPISGFTWLLVYKEQNYNGRSLQKAKTLVNLLWWMTHQGQVYANALDYAVLPKKVTVKVDKILHAITYNGKSVLARGK